MWEVPWQAMKTKTLTIQPVSYTHLDVYKRQAQGIPKPVAVTGSHSVFPIVCRVDNSADATNSFTSLTVDFEAITAHWAESGSCVYSKAGTRQTHLAAVERAGGNFAQADFHYNYPMIGSILEQNGQFYAFLESSTINPAGLSPVSYTHLDVYKRQVQGEAL